MPTVSYRYNEDTKTIQRVTQMDTPAPIVEDIDPLGLDPQIQNLKEQIGGFEQAKLQVQADADARKADMNNKIDEVQAQVDALQAQKDSIYSQIPNLADILQTLNSAVQQAQPATSVDAPTA